LYFDVIGFFLKLFKYSIFMKSFFVVLLIFFGVQFGFSQSKTYQDIPRHSFEGIKTFDGKLFYSTHYGTPLKETPYNYVIQTFNTKLERVSRDVVPVKYLSSIADVAPHQGGILVYVQSAKEGLVYCYNAKGMLAWTQMVALEKSQFHQVKIVSMGNNGFVIVRPDELKKDGFRVTLYGDKMVEKWTQNFIPEKGNITYSLVSASNDRVAVLARFSQSAFSVKFEERVYMLSTKDGSVIYEKVVASELTNSKPEEILVDQGGALFMVGYQFDPAKSFGEVVTHLVYTGLDAKGDVLFDKKLSMNSDLKPQILSERATQLFGLNDAPLIHFSNIRRTGSGYQVLGETYRYIKTPVTTAPGTTPQISQPGKLYVMDYVVINIGENGRLDGVKRIAKPYKRVDTEGHTVGFEYKADDYFAAFGLFAYRFLEEEQGQPLLVSHNWSRNNPYIGFTSLEVSHENILNRIYLDRAVSQGDAGQYSTYLFKKEGVQTPLQTYLYDVLPYDQPGKVLFYDFSNEELTLKVIDRSVAMPMLSGNELVLSGIPGSQFQGIQPIDQQGYFTFYFGEQAEKNTSLYVYHRFDLDMNTLGRSVVSVPNTAVFSGNVASGKNQVVVFQDSRDRSWYLFEMDEQGKLVSDQMISLDKDAKKYPTGNVQFGSAPDGFYLLQTYWDEVLKLNGLLVIRVGQTGQMKWTWSHQAEKDEMLQLVGSHADAGRLAILYTQRTAGGWNKFLNRIIVLDDAAGKMVFEHNLFDGKDSGFPEYIKVATDKSIVTSGMYFKGEKFDAQNSDGLFFLKLKPDGAQANYLKTPWSEVETALKVTGSSDFLVSGKVKVLIQDMVMMTDGSYKVIGELYRKSVGTTGVGFLMGDDLGDRAFSIFDFIVFDYNQGKLASVYRIPKAEQNILLPGSIGQQKGLALSLMMRNYNMFSYLKTLNVNGQHQIVFTNNIDRSKLIFTAPVAAAQKTVFPSAPAEYIIPRSADEMSKLDRINKRLEDLGYGLEKTITGTDQTFTTFRDPYRGFALAETARVLVYFYDPDARSLFVRLEKLK
jgi:hypothetical protein